MIHLALKTIVDDLNAAFRRQRDDARDRLVISTLLDQSGQLEAAGDDKIYVFVTQISEEKNAASSSAPARSPAGAAQVRAPIHLNIDVMFAAMYGRYEVGLQMLSEVIAYLNGKPLFTGQNTPAMDPSLERLTLNLVKLCYADQSYLWGALGANYLPSVLYTVRMLSFGGGRIEALPPAVTQPEVAVGPATASG